MDFEEAKNLIESHASGRSYFDIFSFNNEKLFSGRIKNDIRYPEKDAYHYQFCFVAPYSEFITSNIRVISDFYNIAIQENIPSYFYIGDEKIIMYFGEYYARDLSFDQSPQNCFSTMELVFSCHIFPKDFESDEEWEEFTRWELLDL